MGATKLLMLRLSEGNLPSQLHPKLKLSSEQVYLKNFCWAPDSCRREAGRSSRKLSRKGLRERSVWGVPVTLMGKFLHRGFRTSETRIRARILGNEFWTPECRTRILGSNFLSLFFSSFQNSTQKSGKNIHIAPLQGH